MKAFFDNTSEAIRNPKARDITFYIDKIKEIGDGREFAKLVAFCTDGDIKPTYPYQWVATSTLLTGDDDPFEGVGSSPFEAIKDLWKQMKLFLESYSLEEEN